jgi:hypothetical protein
VDGCQEQGILEESSSGSRGSYCAVALIMMITMMMSTSKHLCIPASKSCEQYQSTKERCLFCPLGVASTAQHLDAHMCINLRDVQVWAG